MPIYKTDFTPHLHLSEDEQAELRAAAEEHYLPPTYEVRLLRRRGEWITQIPARAWDPANLDFSSYDEAVRRDELAEKRRADHGSYGYGRTRDVVLREGFYFYRDSAISALGPYLTVPVIAKALIRFLHHIEKHKTIKAPRVVRPPVDREHDGRRHRGPLWSEYEDHVVRKWFGRHTVGDHIGKHVKLTPEQWKIVLDELKGQRRKTDVLRRIKELNRQLRMSLEMNGYISRAAAARYKREALGESEVRIPRGVRRLGVERDYSDN